MAKKILVACGTAIATSTVVAKKIEKVCKEQGIACMTVQCKASEAVSKAKTLKPDVIVGTCQISGDTGVPVINGRSFLTGVNLQATIDELMEVLKK
ncbi:PTS galactitol transporter subunit IIB [Alkalibaculum sp. M08DMB]|uniref:PTS galactitol transporter subunit IIB n=1 Tax=Alkalibaculum sporogenes TaxID=2655001 RepID=A0A6A7K766_9FIRM|nr:PTS sugar transporter subunit IIB [Alkalibaculum sporogenes]MPW25339.1 PTS galactitol transporter subunit IIB [Alkalibaculum sporogenes]